MSEGVKGEESEQISKEVREESERGGEGVRG